MEYLNEEGLAALWDDTKEYVEKYHGENSGEQESDGTEAGPISELTAKGHAEQLTTLGKNLACSAPALIKAYGKNTSSEWSGNAYTKNGITFTVNADGSVKVSGTSTSQVQLHIPVVSGVSGDCIISGGISSNAHIYGWDFVTNVRLKAYDGTTSSDNDSGNGAKVKVVGDHETAIILRIVGGITVDATFYPQLELGSTATSYEPYTGGAPSPSPDYPQEIQVVRGRNLLDPSTMVIGGINDDGTLYTSSQTYVRTDKIPVMPSTQYVASTSYAANSQIIIGEWAADGTYLGFTFRSAVTYFTFVTKPTTGFVCVVFRNNTTPPVKVSDFTEPQLTVGSTQQPYVPYGHVGLEAQGKNLFNPSGIAGRTNNGITYAVEGDGIKISGTATANSYWLAAQTFTSLVLFKIPAGTYTLSCDNHNVLISLGGFTLDGTKADKVSNVQNSATFTTDVPLLVYPNIRVNNGISINAIVHVQLEKGSTPTPYQPYHKSTTPIPLPSRGWVAGLPNGMSDILTLDGAGKVVWEKCTEEIELDGSSDEDWTTNGNRVEWNKCIAARGVANANTKVTVISSHFIAATANETFTGTSGVSYNNTGVDLHFSDGTGSMTVESWKTWLSTNHVTVLYPLATPVTEQRDYVDLPEIPEGASISCPELDALNVKYYVDDSASTLARQYYNRAKSEYEGRIASLEEAVAEIIAGA